MYGIEFNGLVEQLELFGEVDLIGASFGIAAIKNPGSGRYLDFSIPRADSKVDKGHKGFQVTGDPNMSVREAARRRDLTINSLAMDPLTGELIDNYGGVEDIKAGVLRATDMELFGDDPLRVLRVMQFAGRFNFAVDPATAELCKTLDLTELTKERIGQEWIKLMRRSERPSVGLRLARELCILDQLHPELAVLDQVEQEPDWHPEGNVWVHTMLAADAAAHVVRQEQLHGNEALIVIFGALCHDLGKTATTKVCEVEGRSRITSRGHDVAGVEPSRAFLESIKMKPVVIS
ncbi:MAG TPA: HDIG domain-containing protein, partial [Verrucomicrobiae bacterium]|nr:HDIG domain-containing protein [Verrucomicrobiae bacterium]